MDWMIVEKSLEEELRLEKTLRAIKSCDDMETIRNLCVALTLQGFHHSKLLSQAVTQIASLEALDR